MPAVLICAPDPLTDELHGTLLWREGVERHVATRFSDALTVAVAARPQLVVVDRDFPDSEKLVASLREDRSTRGASIVVIARGDFQAREIHLLEAGANAILRLPVTEAWDERLSGLLKVAQRRSARIPVRLDFEAQGETMVEVIQGTVLNLSTNGMLVETGTSLAVGTDLEFHFDLPPSAEPVAGRGTIIRLAASGRYGVRFHHLEGDAAARIDAFVAGAVDAV
jgi:DNA-binding response OmpR family regulator